MLSFKSGIGKSPHFELDNGVVFGEESNENNFNSWLRTDGNNTPSHSLMTPLPLSPPEPTGGNMTVTSPMTLTPPDPTGGNLNERDANALASALAQHTEALTGSHQAIQDLMRSVGALTAAIKGMENRMKSRNTTATRKTHNKKNESI